MASKGQRIMSDQLKQRLAQEMGIADRVVNGNWGNVSARDCGNLVKAAIRHAQQQLQSR